MIQLSRYGEAAFESIGQAFTTEKWQRLDCTAAQREIAIGWNFDEASKV